MSLVYSWSAIARGAVIKGIASHQSAPGWRVNSRKSDVHLGTVVYRDFVDGKHDRSRRRASSSGYVISVLWLIWPVFRYWDDLEGCWKCRDLMSWFINRVRDS